jgi:DNA-binding MarR family transcriptional regulator
MNIKELEINLKNVKELTPDIYKSGMELSVPFFMVHKKLYENGNGIISSKYSLNQTELDILATLYYMSDGTFTLTPTKLYEVMLFSSGGMTKVLKKLESKELIERVENESDKRSKLVRLSQKGKSITKEALKEVISFEDEVFSKLDEQEQEQLKKILYKLL